MSDPKHALKTASAIVLGGVGWTLTEYWLHRELGHNPKLIKNPFGDEHTAHHSRGNYFAPTWKKLLTAVAATTALMKPARWVTDEKVSAAFVGGFVGAYLYYETLHRLEHVHSGWGRYGRWARKHHFYHHFHNPKHNHGVTSPIWDIVFGTYSKADVIRVPEKLKMDWLCDKATGEVHPHLREDYELRRPKPRKAA